MADRRRNDMRKVCVTACAVLALSGFIAAAPGATTVGILPFDVATGEAATTSTSQSLAKLVRIEMMKNDSLQPVLIDVPAGQRLPLSAEQAAELGKSAQVNLVVAGTV